MCAKHACTARANCNAGCMLVHKQVHTPAQDPPTSSCDTNSLSSNTLSGLRSRCASPCLHTRSHTQYTSAEQPSRQQGCGLGVNTQGARTSKTCCAESRGNSQSLNNHTFANDDISCVYVCAAVDGKPSKPDADRHQLNTGSQPICAQHTQAANMLWVSRHTPHSTLQTHVPYPLVQVVERCQGVLCQALHCRRVVADP